MNGPEPETISAPPRPFEPAFRVPGAWATLAITFLIALAVDLGTKHAAFEYVADVPVPVLRERVLEVGPQRLHTLIPPHAPVVVVPQVLELQLVLNAGAVFGAGQGKRWVFIPFAFVAIGFCLWMFGRWTDRRDGLSHICIGLIIAGGVGNLYDRIMFACVRDFLHPLPHLQIPFGLKWPSGDAALWPYVSNVADAFLIIGIGLLMIRLWRSPHPAPLTPSKR